MRGPTAAGLLAAAAALTLSSCRDSEQAYQPVLTRHPQKARELTFAVHPLHNPAMLHRTYRPLIDYLNATVTGARFKLVASRDYAAFDRRLAAGEFDFALPNPYQAVQSAASGYRIFGKVSGDEGFRGLILVRRGSPIDSVDDLRGRTISYPAPTAVAATMLPQFYLHSHGLPLSATRSVYVGSMESTIGSVLSGTSDAGATWPDPWEKYRRAHPGEAARLEVRWTTPPLVNNALVVHRSQSAALAARVLEALQRLSKTALGRSLLEKLSLPGFESASPATYEPVRRFLVTFSKEVRPLPAWAEVGS